MKLWRDVVNLINISFECHVIKQLFQLIAVICQSNFSNMNRNKKKKLREKEKHWYNRMAINSMQSVLPRFARKSNKSYYLQRNHKQKGHNAITIGKSTCRKNCAQNKMKQTQQNKIAKCDFIENICLLWRCQLVQRQININVMLFAVIRCPFLSLLITGTKQKLKL